MSQINIYKPRYKIAFQAKSKIWPYKNSRMRRFFNIRGRKLVRRGLFKRYFLVFNNMKWTIARRYIRPYMKKRRPIRQRYKNVFYLKQQLRAFYGKQKEEVFRNFFKRFIGGAKGRNNMFAVALERRADMVLFRLRFLPTIYACHQFVHHYGININGKSETSPNALVRPGDIITFEKKHWLPFVEFLYERLYWRVYGLNVWKRRQFKSLRKKVWWIYKNKFFKKSNVNILRKLSFVVRKVLKINSGFSKYIPNLYKEMKNLEMKDNSPKNKIFVHLRKNLIIYWKNYRNSMFVLIRKIQRLFKNKVRFKLWSWRYYYMHYFTLLSTIFRLYKTLKFYFSKLKLLELNFYKNLILFSKDYDWNDEKIRYAELKESVDSANNNAISELTRLNKIKSIMNKRAKVLSEKIFIFKKRYKKLLWNNVKNNIDNFKSNKNALTILLNCIKFLNKKQLVLSTEKQNIQEKISFIIKTQKSNILKNKVILNTLAETIQQKIVLKNKIINLISKQQDLLENSLEVFNEKLELLMSFVLKRRIRRYSLKPRIKFDSNSGQQMMQKSPIIYFLTRRRFKKARKIAIPRLKNVHWYIPNYIYFDFRTLRAVYLYNPKPEEIVYSFKCSLPRIHAFYRSLGL